MIRIGAAVLQVAYGRLSTRGIMTSLKTDFVNLNVVIPLCLFLDVYVEFSQHNNKITFMFTATCFDSQESSSGYV
jgi:hypothetical protein